MLNQSQSGILTLAHSLIPAENDNVADLKVLHIAKVKI